MTKRKKILLILMQIFIITSLLLLERFVISRPFSLDRVFILYVFFAFISLHAFIKASKIWNFIYEKRYILAIVVFIFFVANKYNFSSSATWNNVVPSGDTYIKNSTPFLGLERSIRSDEWMVGTPTILSQAATIEPFSTHNNVIMSRNALVTLFPSLPTKRVTIIGKLLNIGYLFLDIERGFSFESCSKVLLLLFVSFEFCMILTKNNKKYSLLGMFLIGFSPEIAWWSSIDCILWGELAICIFYLFINAKNKYYKLLYSIIFGIVGLNYILLLYPAWQVTFGYFYAIIVFWLIMVNKSKLKWSDLLYLIPVVTIIVSILVPVLLENKEVFMLESGTVYPGERFSIGGSGWNLLFNYFSTIFYPFKNLNNPCENAQFISLFPIPIIMGIYYSIVNIKNKKRNSSNALILVLSIFSILLFVWNVIEIPEIISKVTLLSFSTPERSQVVIGYVMVVLIVLILSNYENNRTITIKEFLFIGFIVSVIVSFGMSTTINSIDPNYMNKYMIMVSCVMFSLLMSVFIINNKKYNIYFLAAMCVIGFISGATVNPITKGLSVYYEKPLSKKVVEIVDNDPNAKWISVNNWHLQNYIIANGASTINSTNYYPNLDLWKKIDPDGVYNYAYNRYAHIVIKLTDEETNFNLDYMDSITLNLNVKDICILDVDYIVTTDILDTKKYGLEEIYSKYGIQIYKTNACQ